MDIIVLKEETLNEKLRVFSFNIIAKNDVECYKCNRVILYKVRVIMDIEPEII